jgi:hypothetical protein
MNRRILSTRRLALRSRLSVEPLEDRTLPSTTMSTSILQPNANAIVNGTYLIKAQVKDHNSITKLQFYLDGNALGPAITSGPNNYYWDTTTATDGPHTLTDTAWDSAGNVLQSPGQPIQVNNNYSQVGQWGSIHQMPIVAINMILMHTGNVLLMQGNGTTAQVLNPNTGNYTAVPNNYSNLFCAGAAELSDGRILVTGGYGSMYQGTPNVNLFDPVALTWTEMAPMSFARWYPTMTGLPDGEMMAIGGAGLTNTTYVPYQETYEPPTNTWTTLTNAQLTLPSYPHSLVQPDGNILVTGASEVAIPTYELNLTTQTWTTIDPNVVDGASSDMFLPGKVLKIGTASDSGGTKKAAATTYLLDMTQPSPHWQQLSNMMYPRATTVNLVTLPDGNVMVFGGGTNTNGADLTRAVFPAEEWSPITEKWTEMSSMEVPRLYHSTTLLLPDGRVLEAGSGGDVGPDQTNYQIYSPSYLFKGARPTITSVASTLQYGNSFFVGTPDAANIASVSLIRPGAVTHGFDQDQRFLPLSFSQTSGGLTVQAPINSDLAPPGYYMLFIVNKNGVPSIAPFVRFPGAEEDTTPPTAPGSLAAMSLSGGTSLTWTASTDNWIVNGYTVYRSTNPNFVPSPANEIGQTTATSYTDVVAPGTYYYLVTAQDFVGNASTPSNETSATPTLDVTAPTVSLTGWNSGATVFGTIALTANAQDNIAVAGVQFYLDGAPLGTQVTSAPYYFNWNTAGVANGQHTVTAVASDYAGNRTTSTSITLNINNTTGTNGLVAAYGFNDGSGTTVTDSSANGLTGTISNATWSTAGKYGNALVFNGTNSLVTVNDAPVLNLTNGMTIEAWVYRMWSNANTWQTVIFKEQPEMESFALQGTDPNVYSPPSAYINTGGLDATVYGGGFMHMNQWEFLAATYDGSQLALYVNGKKVQTAPMTGNIAETNDPLHIGGNALWGEFLKGMIDEVRIYSRALSQSEIVTDMNTPISSVPLPSSAAIAALRPSGATGIAVPIPFSPSDGRRPAASEAINSTWVASIVPNGPDPAAVVSHTLHQPVPIGIDSYFSWMNASILDEGWTALNL